MLIVGAAMWINATAGRGRVRCRLPARVRRGGRNGKSAVWAFDCRLARANRLDWWMEECATAFAYQPASATRSVQLRWMCCWSLPLNHSHRAALGLAVASVRTGDLVSPVILQLDVPQPRIQETKATLGCRARPKPDGGVPRYLLMSPDRRPTG